MDRGLFFPPIPKEAVRGLNVGDTSMGSLNSKPAAIFDIVLLTMSNVVANLSTSHPDFVIKGRCRLQEVFVDGKKLF